MKHVNAAQSWLESYEKYFSLFFFDIFDVLIKTFLK